MPDYLKSNVRLFADDIIVYLAKYHHMLIAKPLNHPRNKKAIIFSYTLHDHLLKATDNAKETTI